VGGMQNRSRLLQVQIRLEYLAVGFAKPLKLTTSLSCEVD
jgi:hypothetical protein